MEEFPILSSKPPTSQELDGRTKLLPLVCSSCRVRHIVITLKPSRMVKNHSSLQIGWIKCPKIAHSFCTGIEFSSCSYICVLQLIRAIREGNFSLYKKSLVPLLPWMFSLDHINYARWLSVHIRDMSLLFSSHPDIRRPGVHKWIFRCSQD